MYDTCMVLYIELKSYSKKNEFISNILAIKAVFSMGLNKKKSGRQRTFIGDIQVASGVMFSGDVDHSKSVHAMAEDECDAKQVITGFFYLRMIHFCR